MTVLVGTLSSDVVLATSGQWYDGPSVDLTPGTWFLMGVGQFAIPPNYPSKGQMLLEFYAGGNEYSIMHRSMYDPWVDSVTCSWVLEVAQPTTVVLRARANPDQGGTGQRLVASGSTDYGRG